MKKTNNKGFAVSTLLYGLMLVAFLIISLLMSIMATNRKNTSTLVKKIEEELNRYSNTTTEIISTDGAQEFIVPYGKAGWYKIELWGAAAYGVDEVAQTEARRGTYTTGLIYLEENEHLYFHIGTQGTTDAASSMINKSNVRAGGSTDVRTTSGAWNDAAGLNSRIMVAGGGGYNSGNTGFEYQSFPQDRFSKNYAGKTYISGYPGFDNSDKSKYFVGAKMYFGVNAGIGKAKIEQVSMNTKFNPPGMQTITIRRLKMRYIKDCVSITSKLLPSDNNYWTKVSVVGMDGKNIDVTTYTESESTPSRKCAIFDLGNLLDEIAEVRAYHYLPNSSSTAEEYIYGNTLYLSEKVEQTGKSFYNNMPEDIFGYGINEYDFAQEHIPIILNSNFYIVPALYPNKALTIRNGEAVSNLLNGVPESKFAITSISNGYFKILDTIERKALQPKDGAQEAGEFVSLESEFKNAPEESWRISKLNSSSGIQYFKLYTGKNSNLCLEYGERYTMQRCSDSNKNQLFTFVSSDY